MLCCNVKLSFLDDRWDLLQKIWVPIGEVNKIPYNNRVQVPIVFLRLVHVICIINCRIRLFFPGFSLWGVLLMLNWRKISDFIVLLFFNFNRPNWTFIGFEMLFLKNLIGRALIIEIMLVNPFFVWNLMINWAVGQEYSVLIIVHDSILVTLIL